jgi:hypothetical protein
LRKSLKTENLGWIERPTRGSDLIRSKFEEIMTPATLGKRPGGATVLELLISATLLLVLTGLLGSLLPAYEREDWFGNKQNEIRGFLIARERLTQELRNVELLDMPGPEYTADGCEILLRYQKPIQTSTSVGDLSKVTYSEVVEFDESTSFEVLLSPDNKVLFRNVDTDIRRQIWSLGEEAKAQVVVNFDDYRVDFNFEGTTSEKHSGKSNWNYSVVVFVK